MATVSASLSSKVDARGKAEILLRFVAGRDHIYRLHSGLYVTPSRWKDGGIVIPRLETDEQQELKATRSRLEALRNYLLARWAEADRSEVDRAWMQEAVESFHHPMRGSGEDLLAMFSEFRRAKDVSEYRQKRYAVTERALERYQIVRGRRLTVGGLKAAVLEDFRAFLEEEPELAKEAKWGAVYDDLHIGERGKNSVLEYMKVIRAFVHWAIKKGVKMDDPFRQFEIGAAAYGTPYYLTVEERDRLWTADLSARPGLAVQRDIFIFQCLVGCRVGDLERFRKTDVVEGILSYFPRKTRDGNPVVVRVPLNAAAQEIVDRYSFLPGEQLLPCISTQKYNDAIKEAFRLAGLDRKVTVLDPLTRESKQVKLCDAASSHLARRTFIGNLYKQVQDPDLIGSLSGHTEGSRAFARYRTIDDDLKEKVVKLLDKK